MRKVLGLILLLIDVSILPALLAYYVIFSIDLLYGCAMTKGKFQKEFNDFNEIVEKKIKTRLDTYKELILG